MKSIDLDNLAVMFRTNDPNLGHVSTWDAMHEAGLAYLYGLYRGTPERYTRKRRAMREQIAQQLDHLSRRVR